MYHLSSIIPQYRGARLQGDCVGQEWLPQWEKEVTCGVVVANCQVALQEIS